MDSVARRSGREGKGGAGRQMGEVDGGPRVAGERRILCEEREQWRGACVGVTNVILRVSGASRGVNGGSKVCFKTLDVEGVGNVRTPIALHVIDQPRTDVDDDPEKNNKPAAGGSVGEHREGMEN